MKNTVTLELRKEIESLQNRLKIAERNSDQYKEWWHEQRERALSSGNRVSELETDLRSANQKIQDLVYELHSTRQAIMEYALALSIDAPHERLISLQREIAGRSEPSTCTEIRSLGNYPFNK